jgi:hypothetical protein
MTVLAAPGATWGITGPQFLTLYAGLILVSFGVAIVARSVVSRGGARLVVPAEEQHGWLLGRIEDPYGHHWEIGKPLGEWPPAR